MGLKKMPRLAVLFDKAFPLVSYCYPTTLKKAALRQFFKFHPLKL